MQHRVTTFSSNPNDPDSDDDGLGDAAEAALGLDAYDPDSDDDGITDDVEAMTDSDGDGFVDAVNEEPLVFNQGGYTEQIAPSALGGPTADQPASPPRTELGGFTTQVGDVVREGEPTADQSTFAPTRFGEDGNSVDGGATTVETEDAISGGTFGSGGTLAGAGGAQLYPTSGPAGAPDPGQSPADALSDPATESLDEFDRLVAPVDAEASVAKQTWDEMTLEERGAFLVERTPEERRAFFSEMAPEELDQLRAAGRHVCRNKPRKRRRRLVHPSRAKRRQRCRRGTG